MSSYLDRIIIVHIIAIKAVIYFMLSFLANIVNCIILILSFIQSPFEYIITGKLKNLNYGFELVGHIERTLNKLFLS